MGWNKISEHQFTYNEGSLNFTLSGGAFHDDDGDGVPEGVSFENGRPVFTGIKNLKDFHFDVPRGYLIVNGKEYKLLDLDNNAENGEELQLFNEDAAFPQGTDRTNKKAYKKVSPNQFTYNEGSLNFTLTGGAFHDNDGDGVPDGVQIIGPKPCFGADGTVFDTSVENFHFKVPSGALMVNGDRYSLAELDNNPDNGYELVIPEKAAVDGWSVVEGPVKGFAYRRSSDNDPINKGSFRLFGDDLVDTNHDNKPDGVTVPVVRIGEMIDGVRVTRIAIDGLSGDVKLNHPQYSFGVYNDDNYGVEIVKHGGDLHETIYTNISPGATLVVSTGTENFKTDGDGKIKVLASKSFKINDQLIEVDGDKFLTVKIKNNAVQKIKAENLGWKQKGNKLKFTGRPANDPLKKVKFTISGEDLNLENVKVSVLRNVKGLGVRVGIDGLSGEVNLNGKPLGISGDDNYSVHFTPIVDKNIAPENVAQVKSLELLNISPGATINSRGNWIILDGDGEYHFGKGNYLVATQPAHSVDELTEVEVDEGGADISVTDGVLGIVGKVMGAFIEAVEDFIDYAKSEQIQLAEFISQNLFEGENFAFDEFEDILALNQSAPNLAEISPTQISSEIINAENISCEKINAEVITYAEV